MFGLQRYELSQELTACLGCGSPRITHLHAIRSSRLRNEPKRLVFVSGCRDCGLVFVNPSKSEAELAAYYTKDGGWNARAPERAERVTDLSATPKRKRIADKAESKGILKAAVVQARRQFGTTEG